MTSEGFTVIYANDSHTGFSQQICDEMESSAKERGTGIAKRSPEYISAKMHEGKAVIALTNDGEWAGFCYIEAWENKNFVANSGLIVAKPYRKTGLARMIKHKIFELSRTKYPEAKIFGLTTGLAVMKINSDLGYVPVTYSELTSDENFWNGCKSCVNYDILTSKNFKNCLCTGMLFDPNAKKNSQDVMNNSVVVAESKAAKIIPIYPSKPLRRIALHFISAIRHGFSVLFSSNKNLTPSTPAKQRRTAQGFNY